MPSLSTAYPGSDRVTKAPPPSYFSLSSLSSLSRMAKRQELAKRDEPCEGFLFSSFAASEQYNVCKPPETDVERKRE